jgi:UDP-glucose 4-epimerase
MKTYLITGVAGLLGSRLADFITTKNLGVVVGVDDLSGGDKENVNSDVIFFQRKCQDDLTDIFDEYSIDIVYHFAAYAAEGLSPFIRKFNYENNLKATANIVNYCITYDVDRLVFTSTLAVYGHGNFDVFDEKQVPKPIDPYGVAKYGCEMDIQIAGEQHGLDWCIIRPHNVYGLKQNIWDKYRNVLGIWMFQYLNGESFSIFGDGTQTRAFSYIDDSLKPLYQAGIESKASGEIINLGGIEETRIIDAAHILRGVIGDDNIEIKHFEARHEVKHSIPTWKKSVDILGFEHKTSLKAGLTEMWSWAQAQKMKERFVWDQYEIEKDIYSYWK